MTNVPEYFQGNEWMCTFTGRHVYPLALKVEDIDIKDIAHHLAMQCRYNGSVNRFYSVAEHCYLISHALLRDGYPLMVAYQGLTHDAAETYTGDMIRPVKNSLRSIWSKWKEIEESNEETIAIALGVDHPYNPAVKQYDRRIIQDEKAQLGMNTWAWDQEALGVTIHGWSPAEAEANYLAQYDYIKLNLESKAA